MRVMLLPVLLAAMVASCRQGDATNVTANTLDPAAATLPKPMPAASAGGTQFGSQVPALAFIPLDRLPANPSPAALSGSCDHLLMTPATKGGRLAGKLGWGVTAEVPVEGRTAVSFVGSAAPATSGTCTLGRGNIGIFDGDRIVAIAYARPSAKQSIGSISPLDGGGARVWDGDLVPRPVADLMPQHGGGLAIEQVAGADAVCGRTATVPKLYDRPIDQARIALRKAGWTPVPGQKDGDVPEERAAELVATGIVEAQDCAGTGFGFCSFAYHGAAGSLSVITVGDGPMPVVSGYRVTCRKR